MPNCITERENLQTLIGFSRRCGSDSSLTVAGGGNTSMKADGVLYVKSSGTALGTIDENGFVALDLKRLLSVLDKTYPAEDAAREAAFLADVQAAKLPGQEGKRPSVEALLHALFPRRYVLHLHPTLVNGLTCARDGEQWAAKLFPEALWVPECRPGYTLAKLLSERMRPGTDTVLLQNHGVFFAADGAEELDKMLNHMLGVFERKYSGTGEKVPRPALDQPFTPDQIVYCGVGPELPNDDMARAVYMDATKIACLSAWFGGPRPMSAELNDFIVNWEAESHRKSKS
ncbi:MAG: class II aldolase/adducin family protein [Firmicutes bacterium]|nr:class II aldolase/adducin family protein [Bacillota bacterium]